MARHDLYLVKDGVIVGTLDGVEIWKERTHVATLHDPDMEGKVLEVTDNEGEQIGQLRFEL